MIFQCNTRSHLLIKAILSFVISHFLLQKIICKDIQNSSVLILHVYLFYILFNSFWVDLILLVIFSTHHITLCSFCLTYFPSLGLLSDLSILSSVCIFTFSHISCYIQLCFYFEFFLCFPILICLL